MITPSHAISPPDNIGLYVHFPWCVKKCPYCDFNSHPLNSELPETEYVDALLADWQAQQGSLSQKNGQQKNGQQKSEQKISSVFFGGGTPSLFQPDSFARLIERISPFLAPAAELTMEANPGTLEYGNLADYHQAGINRLSMGVQSFDDDALQALGRIHSAGEARVAIDAAQHAGFDNINIDLMHGLPQQTQAAAQLDLTTAINACVQHISWYQLTIEPRTEFAQRPPQLPDEDTLGDIETTGLLALHEAGFARYEISAYAQPGRQSQHNRNYWEFGDYLGLGAGAHGKLSSVDGSGNLQIRRTAQPRQPRLYLQQAADRNWQLTANSVPNAELPSEFMMNALRLLDGVPDAYYEARTGQPLSSIEEILGKWRRMGIMRTDRLGLTPMGLNALDTVVGDFLA